MTGPRRERWVSSNAELSPAVSESAARGSKEKPPRHVERRPQHVGQCGGRMRARMPLRVRRLVLVAVAVACASVPATAVAAGAPATASVIVYRCGADFANLCRLDPLSRHDQPLTSDGNQSMAYQSPSLSRDGRHLAFVFNQQVYVGDANAAERQP